MTVAVLLAGRARQRVPPSLEIWLEGHIIGLDLNPGMSVPKPAQKPHPPIVLGSITSRRVFKRIVAWGDGWMPVGVSLEQIKHGRETLNQLAAEAGRDPRSIQIVAFFVSPDPEALQAFEEAGVDAALITLETAGEKDALTKLEEIAHRVLT